MKSVALSIARASAKTITLVPQHTDENKQMTEKALLTDGDGLELWSAETLGRRTGLGKRRIYKLAAEFGLPAVRVGGRMWFRPQEVDAYFVERTGAVEAA